MNSQFVREAVPRASLFPPPMPGKAAGKKDKNASTPATTGAANINVAVRRSSRATTVVASAASQSNSEIPRSQPPSKPSTQRQPRTKNAPPVTSDATNGVLAAMDRPSALKGGRGLGTTQTLQVGFTPSVLQAQPDPDPHPQAPKEPDPLHDIGSAVDDHLAPIFRNQEFCNFLGQEYANAQSQCQSNPSLVDNDTDEPTGKSLDVQHLPKRKPSRPMGALGKKKPLPVGLDCEDDEDDDNNTIGESNLYLFIC
jgi:hypothetical protein